MCVLFLLLDIALNDTTEAGAVRLVGGNTPLEGRVEVFLLGQWGAVCDYYWDLADATVVCRQLGYPRAVEAPRSAFFGAGSGPSWYSYVTCTGTELNLNECAKSVSSLGKFCTHSLDAGVRCSSTFTGSLAYDWLCNLFLFPLPVPAFISASTGFLLIHLPILKCC